MMIMVKVTWIGHASFMLESAGKRIYIDPYELSEEYSKLPADVIFITHEHGDHFDESSVKLIFHGKTEVVCPITCNGPIKKFNAKGVVPDDKGSASGFEFQAIRAYNPNKRFHPKSNNWLGYIINIENHKIMHTGDTDYIPEYESLEGKVDLALLPVGDNYTMDFNDGIKTIGAIKPQYVIPMHLWAKDPNEFKKLSEKEFPDTKIIVLSDLNKTFKF